MDVWIYPGFQVTQSLGSQKTPGIAQKGSNFVDTSNKHAAGRGLTLDFFVPYAHTNNWTESLTDPWQDFDQDQLVLAQELRRHRLGVCMGERSFLIGS